MADKIKKGSLVRANREKLENSVEAQASDTRFPSYIFDTKGEVVDIKGDYAFVKFGQVPTPNIWLRLDQLEAVGTAAPSGA
ncbi:MAG TPA: NAD(P)H-quinone oxidoreductase subunit O [Allocoleopsis sp.]